MIQCPIALEWSRHRQETQVAMQQVNTIHSAIANVAQDTKHLSKLDDLADIKTSMSTLSQNLVGPATGRKQVSLSAHLLMIVVFATIILIVLIDRSSKTVEITPSGIKIRSESRESDNRREKNNPD